MWPTPPDLAISDGEQGAAGRASLKVGYAVVIQDWCGILVHPAATELTDLL